MNGLPDFDRSAVPQRRPKENKMKDGKGNYEKLRNLNPTDKWHSSQFKRPKKQMPIKAIALALTLFTSGLLLIILGSAIITGHFGSKENDDRGIPLLLLGVLVFIPGGYHTRIAYYSYKGVKGYSYHDIPTGQ